MSMMVVSGTYTVHLCGCAVVESDRYGEGERDPFERTARTTERCRDHRDPASRVVGRIGRVA